jgi:ubiquitin-conjugating enzyme E2 Z
VTPPPAAREDYDMDTAGMEDDSSIPFEPFRDLCKRRFLWYYESYLASVQKGKEEIRDGKAFARMPFEGSHNSMEGKFNYTELERRLRAIKARLDEETREWAEEAKTAKVKDSTLAVNLQRQYEQCCEHYKRQNSPHNLDLEDNNPFVWVLGYLGRPMTNFDGGLFRIKIAFSPRFPEEQPRVNFLTPIFHHRVAPDGTTCYFPPPTRREDVKSHIDAIIYSLEEEHPPLDPRTMVHPEAHKLYWSQNKEDKKLYNRRFRRSVQASLEAVE